MDLNKSTTVTVCRPSSERGTLSSSCRPPQTTRRQTRFRGYPPHCGLRGHSPSSVDTRQTGIVLEPWTRCPVNKVNEDKYRYKDKSHYQVNKDKYKYKDQKDKVSILQGQDKTWSVPEPWTPVRRKVHTYLPC